MAESHNDVNGDTEGVVPGCRPRTAQSIEYPDNSGAQTRRAAAVYSVATTASIGPSMSKSSTTTTLRLPREEIAVRSLVNGSLDVARPVMTSIDNSPASSK